MIIQAKMAVLFLKTYTELKCEPSCIPKISLHRCTGEKKQFVFILHCWITHRAGQHTAFPDDTALCCSLGWTKMNFFFFWQTTMHFSQSSLRQHPLSKSSRLAEINEDPGFFFDMALQRFWTQPEAAKFSGKIAFNTRKKEVFCWRYKLHERSGWMKRGPNSLQLLPIFHYGIKAQTCWWEGPSDTWGHILWAYLPPPSSEEESEAEASLADSSIVSPALATSHSPDLSPALASHLDGLSLFLMWSCLRLRCAPSISSNSFKAQTSLCSPAVVVNAPPFAV